MLIEEFIDVSNRSCSVDELFDHYKKAMEHLGFDRIIFSLMTDHKMIDRDAGHGIIVNYSEEWMKYYMSRNYASYDPVRREMYTAPSSFIWRDLMTLPKMTEL